MPEMQFNTPPRPAQAPLPPQMARSTNDGALRGCVISCLLVAAGMLLLLVVVGFFAYTGLKSAFDAFVSETPRALPQVEMTLEERDVAQAKLNAFIGALENNQPLEPLVLSENEINLLLQSHSPAGKHFQWVYVDIQDGALHAEMSFPLSEIGLGSRYLNGSGEFSITLEDGELGVQLHSLEANGKPVPSQVLDQIEQAFEQQTLTNPELQGLAEQLESITVEGDMLVVTPKYAAPDNAGFV